MPAGARQVGRRRSKARDDSVVAPSVSYMQLTQTCWSGACFEVGLQIAVIMCGRAGSRSGT